MRLAMLLDADSCIELLKLNICFHAAAGIDTVILCSGVGGTQPITPATPERTQKLKEGLSACRVKLDFPDQHAGAGFFDSGGTDLLSWLAQYCSQHDVADWAIAGSVGDYWLATGDLKDVLVAYTPACSNTRGLRVSRSVMVRDIEGCRFSAIHQMNSDAKKLLSKPAAPAEDLFADQYAVKAFSPVNAGWLIADKLEILNYGLQVHQPQTISLPGKTLEQLTNMVINPCMKIYFDQHRSSETKQSKSAA